MDRRFYYDNIIHILSTIKEPLTIDDIFILLRKIDNKKFTKSRHRLRAVLGELHRSGIVEKRYSNLYKCCLYSIKPEYDGSCNRYI